MSDPTRIKRITDKLAALWSTQPDIRLGQLIFDVGFVSDRERDLFNFEDALMEKTIDAALATAGHAPSALARGDAAASEATIIHDEAAAQMPHLGYMRQADAYLQNYDVVRTDID